MPNGDNDNGYDEDWEPIEIEGGSPLRVRVKPDAFKVSTQASNKKKLVCELKRTKLDIRGVVVSSPYVTKRPRSYSRRNCDLKLKTYTKKVDVQVAARKVMIATPLRGWKKVAGSKFDLWQSTDEKGDAPDVKSIDVAGEDPLDGYRKVKYWYKKFS